jgi:hypothetical protein
MRRPKRVVPPEAVDGVPVALLLGPCIEVWAPDVAPDPDGRRAAAANAAFGRWCAARDRLLGGADVKFADRPSWARREVPWSFDFCREWGSPYLPFRLLRAGLPPDWTPEDLPDE